MGWLLYLRLVTLTVGTLLPFFWMVVILGHRRQRNFERIFFFLCLALTCFFGSTLLALNAQLFYVTPPQGLLQFAWTFLCLGLWFVPPLMVHLHVEYAFLRDLLRSSRQKYLWLAIAWIPAIAVSLDLSRTLRLERHFDFERPAHLLGLLFQLWFVVAVALAAYWQRCFCGVAPDPPQKSFHKRSSEYLLALAVLLLVLFFLQRIGRPGAEMALSTFLLLLGLVPLGLLIGNVQRFNFLQIGRQRNLIYAVFAVFLALLYLSFVRRVSLWLDSYLPPEATAALLLFLPVVFFEPLQRVMRKLLRKTAQSEVDRVQKLMRPIHEMARLGDLAKLLEFGEQWIAEQLQLASVKLETDLFQAASGHALAGKSSAEEVFGMSRSGQLVGRLRVRAHGAMISGETYAALEFVAEQLPAAFDLCQLIEAKLQLERELAERERMALVGQMAASISHNLKNPLGSIKTILQVQMESHELPDSLRGETQMVLDEINRLSAKLNQLLQFSRPGVRSTKKGDRCNILGVASDVVEVLRREAESSGVSIESAKASGACEVAGSAEAANDILSNVVLNAIEAAGRGGRVSLAFHCDPQVCNITVEDDGPGIPAGLKEKIVQPFFTTKARGTGLGLAIVMRRLEEIGGKLEIDSPIRGARGSRFRVKLPLSPKEDTP